MDLLTSCAPKIYMAHRDLLTSWTHVTTDILCVVKNGLVFACSVLSYTLHSQITNSSWLLI